MKTVMDGPTPPHREVDPADLLAARDVLWQMLANIEHTGKGDRFRLTSLSCGYVIRFLERSAERTL